MSWKEKFVESKSIPIIGAVIAFLIVVYLFSLSFRGAKPAPEGPEVISKRVKIDIREDAARLAEPSASPKPSGVVETGTDKGVTVTPVKPAEVKTPDQPPVDKKAGIKTADTKPAAAPKAKEAKGGDISKKTLQSARALKKDGPQKTKSTDSAAKLASLKPWAVNVASFSNAPDAKALSSRLKASRYNAYVTEFMKDGVKWHRVRVGFYRSDKEAKVAAKTIAKKFNAKSSWVLRPPKDEIAGHIK